MGVTRYRWSVPYLLMAPGLLFLAVFFVLPNVQMLLMSLSTRAGGVGLARTYEFTWAWENYRRALTAFPDQFANSLIYGGLATLVCLLIGYPLAYGIAFRGGRYKNLLLFLVIAPFFTSFLIRTISWKIILGNDGAVLSIVRDTLGIVPQNFSILGTPLAVVSGLTYQFLPFMVLPLYVSLEKIDRRLIEAAKDLYAGPWRRGGAVVGGFIGGALAVAFLAALGYLPLEPERLMTIVIVALVGFAIGALIATTLVSESFTRVIFPLSLSGVFAGSILTFIPAIGDYVNPELLGNPKTQMIGNVIQNRFLNQNDYPTAAALSFLLMAGILIAIFIYAWALGTNELSGGAE
jgi:spermidine/putrescine transport system permease protein